MRTHTVAATLPRRTVPLFVIAAMVVLLSAASFQSAWAQTAPSLGSAEEFAVLAGSAVVNTGPSTIHGNVGVSPGSAVSGFPPGLIVLPGVPPPATAAVALAAQNDVVTAYNSLASQPCTQSFLPTDDLGGKTLVAGVYCFSSSAQLTGTLTLDGGNNANAVFIFKIGSALTTASSSNVKLIGGAQSCNVFWQVGSSATLGTDASFIGNLLALTSITLTTRASMNGRALARNGAVTLDSNDIFFSLCSTAACIDTRAPSVAVTGMNPGSSGHTQVFITVQDTGCGLASIGAIIATNTTIVIPVFTPGTTSPIVVTATKITAGAGSVVGLKATDVNGNVTIFDPVDFTITAGTKVALSNIPREEHFVTIMNEGLQALIITVNGNDDRRDRVDRDDRGDRDDGGDRGYRSIWVWLKPNTTRTIDIGRAMVPGNDNTITFEALGTYGRAVILVHPK